uniref:Kelch domain-containing protein 8B n=1 Tax=Pan troglodytes TaxID=9598 RepID=A0A2I3T7Y2_PANTR
MSAGGGRAFAWQVFPPMPTCRVYGTVAHQDGHLLVLGGCGRAGLPLDTAETLDMASHTWLALAPLPTARAGAAAVVLGKQVLVVGGVDEVQSPVAAVEAFLMDEGRWERRATLPQAAMGVATVERDGMVYALGGMGPDTAPQAQVRVYEPRRDCWLSLPSMPTPCYGASTFLHGNKIYVLGSWTKLPRSLRMRDKRADFVVGSLGGHIVAIGGLGNQPCPLGSVESFSLAQRRWEALPAMPTARCSCSSLQAGPRLFVIGGVAQGPSQAVEALCLRDGV